MCVYFLADICTYLKLYHANHCLLHTHTHTNKTMYGCRHLVGSIYYTISYQNYTILGHVSDLLLYNEHFCKCPPGVSLLLVWPAR